MVAEDRINSTQKQGQRLRLACYMALGVVALLWLVAIVSFVFAIDLVNYGIYPREYDGMRGIIFAPVIHGSWPHLFANSGPLFVLTATVIYGYRRSAFLVLPILYFGVGLAVWLFARDAYHIGASGITFGLMFYIFTIGLLRWEKQSMVLSMIVFFLYGGMVGGLLGTESGISFESHIAGAVLGILCAKFFKAFDPPAARKKYTWEDDEQDVLDEESSDEYNHHDDKLH